MKRARKLALVLLVLAGLSFIPSIITWWRLPKFEGKSAQYWFAQEVENRSGSYDASRARRAAAAFQAMGVDAAPFLIGELTAAQAGVGFPWNYLAKIRNPDFLRRMIREQIIARSTRQEQRLQTAEDRLQRLGAKLASAQEPLRRALGEVGDSEKGEVLHLFWLMGPQGSNSVAEVAKYFFSTNSQVREIALSTFDAIAPVGTPELKTLRKAVVERQLRAARGIATLEKLEGQFLDLLPLLAKEISGNDSMNKIEALSVAKQLQGDKGVLIKPLLAVLDHGNPRCRAAALQALQTISDGSAQWLEPVAELLNDEFAYVRAEAARALGRGGAEAGRSLARLKQHENEGNDEVRAAVQEAIRTIEGSL